MEIFAQFSTANLACYSCGKIRGKERKIWFFVKDKGNDSYKVHCHDCVVTFALFDMNISPDENKKP